MSNARGGGRLMMPNSIANRRSLPPATLGIAATTFVIAGLGPNSLLAALAIGILLAGAYLLWRPGESPILLFIFCYQWLQSSIAIFQANWLGVGVIDLPSYGGNVQLAIVLSLLGLLVLASGLRIGAGAWRLQDGALARVTASQFPPQFWFHLYCTAFLIAALAQSLTWVEPGLYQPLIALASLKWAFFWMLAYATFAQPGSNRIFLITAFTLELLLGLGGYFSDFKTPLIFTLLAAMTAGVRLSFARCLGLLSLGALALTLGIAWSAIKEDYRTFVSGGSKAQVVTVGYFDRLSTLAAMVQQLDSASMDEGWEKLLQRVAYVNFFGVVLDTVPDIVPHGGGALWGDAIMRPFMPRLFFPEKSAIDDSVRTNHYTGLNLPTAEEGTSISLGYMAESYIDFGIAGMMVPIFGLGLLLGRFYRWMLRGDAYRLLGMALATATISVASFLESSITKVIGGLAVAMLVSWIVLRIVPPCLGWIPNKMSR